MNMTWFFDLLSTALYTVFIQNLVFNGGYAASEALMLAKKPRRLWMFSAMIAFFSTVTALACRALEMIPMLSTLPSALHFAMFSGVLIVVFLITGLILKLALGATEKFLGTLGMAALNTLVL
ncbi:MAG: Rnf-Nqr domain containing protein, partial [Clostridiales bacterium]